MSATLPVLRIRASGQQARRGSITIVTASWTCSWPITRNSPSTTNIDAISQDARCYCSQTDYKGRPPKLYHNDGGGKFRDVTRASLASWPGRKSAWRYRDRHQCGRLGRSFRGARCFPQSASPQPKERDVSRRGLRSRGRINADGVARAGMGVDAGDIDGDGTPDLIVTNFDSEYHALYQNPGKMPFREITGSSRLAAFTKRYVGWGVRFVDYDNDGDLDLLIANGHLQENISESNRSVSIASLLCCWRTMARADSPIWRKQRSDVLQGLSGPRACDRRFRQRWSGRRRLYRPEFPSRADRKTGRHGEHWMGIQLQGTRSNRDAIGARVSAQQGSRKLTRWINGGSSFLATHDRRLVLGLGHDTSAATQIEIRGLTECPKVTGLAPDRYHRYRRTHEKGGRRIAISPGTSGQL